MIILIVLVDGCSLTVFGPLRHSLGQVVGVTQPLWDGLAADGLEPSIQQDCVLYRAPRRDARRLRGMFALRRCKRARLDKLASASPARAWSLLLTRKHTKLAGTSLVGGIVPAATYDAKVRCFRTGATFQAQGACGLPHVSEGLRQTPCLGPTCAGGLCGRPFDTDVPLTVAPLQLWLGALRSGPDELLARIAPARAAAQDDATGIRASWCCRYGRPAPRLVAPQPCASAGGRPTS